MMNGTEISQSDLRSGSDWKRHGQDGGAHRFYFGLETREGCPNG